MESVLSEHREYLGDPFRLGAFEKALQIVVKPGARVLDLGCGTGILGLLAARAGAGHVTAVDSGGLIESARAIAAANGLGGRITHLLGHSTRIELTEKVDVVVADQFGPSGFEGAGIECFEDAKRRLLKPDGILVPSRLDFEVGLVARPELRGRVEFWDAPCAGLDLSALAEAARNSNYAVRLEKSDLLGTPARVLGLDLGTAPDVPLRGEAELVADRAGRLDGLGGWFVATLAPGVTMTNSPLAPDRIARWNAFLPLERSVDLAAGDRVRVHLTVEPREAVFSWIVEAGGRTSRQSTFKSLFVSREELAAADPRRVPDLDAWGRARRSVLELCDGKRSLAEIEAELRRRHGDLFPARGAAEAFVVRTLAADGR